MIGVERFLYEQTVAKLKLSRGMVHWLLARAWVLFMLWAPFHLFHARLVDHVTGFVDEAGVKINPIKLASSGLTI